MPESSFRDDFFGWSATFNSPFSPSALSGPDGKIDLMVSRKATIKDFLERYSFRAQDLAIFPSKIY
jgi:hypothetical protein